MFTDAYFLAIFVVITLVASIIGKNQSQEKV